MIWTEDMKETLKEMAGENIFYGIIAKRMSAVYGVEFTKNSVIGMAKRIGVPRRPSIIKKPKSEGITIYQLEWGMCKWPMGQIYDKPPFMYCGKKTGGISWCPVHCRKAFTSRYLA